MSERARSRSVDSLTRREAKEAVAALLADLRHIMSTRPHTDWPSMAKAVLNHYGQIIDSSLLDANDKRVHDSARATLEGLVASSFERIRDGIIDLRTNETAASEIGSTPTAAEQELS